MSAPARITQQELNRLWDTSEGIILALRTRVSPGDAGATLMLALGRLYGAQTDTPSSDVAYSEFVEEAEAIFKAGFNTQRAPTIKPDGSI